MMNVSYEPIHMKSKQFQPFYVTDPNSLHTGDILYRRKGPVMHVGVYLGNNQVIHNVPGKGEHICNFEAFREGKDVLAKPSGLPESQIKENAAQLLANPKDYQLFYRNCEHTAHDILKGNPVSRQLEEVEAWALIGAAFGQGFGRKGMVIGGVIGGIAGVFSLPKLWWLR